jgi:hypothetical protein
MRRPLPARRAPLWFYVLVAALVAVALRELVPASPASSGAGSTSHPPALAWFAIIVSIVEAIWKGVEVAGKVALAILQYSVHWAWRAITLLGKGAAELAGYAWKGLRKTWTALKYAVLHPKAAWEKLWHWVDRAEQWLKDTVRARARLAAAAREEAADVLARLRAAVARRHRRDAARPARARRARDRVGETTRRDARRDRGRIAAKYLELAGYVNDVINIVNRVVTADGLFQRLAYIRTVVRDFQLTWNALLNGWHKPLTAGDVATVKKRVEGKPLADVQRDVRAYIRNRSGDDAGLLSEVAVAWRKYLHAAR